jgi:hypothetical protein
LENEEYRSERSDEKFHLDSSTTEEITGQIYLFIKITSEITSELRIKYKQN